MYTYLALNFQANFNSVLELITQWLDQHLVNILVILIGAWLIRRFGVGLISRLLRYTVRPDLYPTKADREKRIKTLNSLTTAIVRTGVYIIAIILIIGEINPNYATALFASAGLIGLALGFGAQSLIKDFFSGIFIITEHQYRVGDVVNIAGVSGVVEDITIRTTVLRDLDGKVYHVPNGSIDVTTNLTIGYSQVNENIFVGYKTDIPHLIHLINRVGEEMATDIELKDKILEAPHFERVDGFGLNGIEIKVLGRTISGEQWFIKGELYKRLTATFAKHQIEIPYQQIVLHQKKASKN